MNDWVLPAIGAFLLVALGFLFNYQLNRYDAQLSERYHAYAVPCFDSGREQVECMSGFLAGTVKYVPAEE